MIGIKKYHDIYVKEPLNFTCKVRGEFKCVLRDENLRYLYETRWIPNLITDVGLVDMCDPTKSTFSNMHIGSSSQAPATSDTALVSWLGLHDSTAPGNGVNDNTGTPNYTWRSLIGRRFDAGTGTGTVRELGISRSNTNTNMSIRALVSPAVTKASNQVLDVYYRIAMWPDLTDTTGQVTLNSELYDYTMRVFGCDSTDVALTTNYAFSGNVSHHTNSPNAMVAITDDPGTSGDFPFAPSGVISGTSYGSGYNDTYFLWGLNNGNNAGGIRTTYHRFGFATFGENAGAQIGWSRNSDTATIQKDYTKQLYMTVRLSIARH